MRQILLELYIHWTSLSNLLPYYQKNNSDGEDIAVGVKVDDKNRNKIQYPCFDIKGDKNNHDF